MEYVVPRAAVRPAAPLALLDLPRETLLRLLCELSGSALLRLGQVCQKLHELVHEEELWERLCYSEHGASTRALAGRGLVPSFRLHWRRLW